MVEAGHGLSPGENNGHMRKTVSRLSSVQIAKENTARDVNLKSVSYPVESGPWAECGVG